LEIQHSPITKTAKGPAKASDRGDQKLAAQLHDSKAHDSKANDSGPIRIAAFHHDRGSTLNGAA
jgi:hypothetical protein